MRAAEPIRHAMILLLVPLACRAALAAAPPAPERSAVDGLIAQAEHSPLPPLQSGPTAFSADFLGPHQVMLINDGPASFELRMKMIEQARSEVDLEYYEFASDTAGRLLLQALVAKKRQMDREHKPFRVRILIDHFFFQSDVSHQKDTLNQFLARELAAHGIEVKYYHPSIWPHALDQRNHQKLFIVDGRQFITGGRNMTDMYFGFNPRFDYQDSDIYVQGAAAGGAQASFNAYWSSDASHVPETPQPPWLEPPPGRRQPDVAERERKAEAYEAALILARQLLEITPELQRARARIASRASAALHDLHPYEASSVTFLSDLPGGGDQSRRVIPEFLREAANARRSLIMENWTFVPIEGEKKVFQGLLARHLPVTLLTNSFESSRIDLAQDTDIINLTYPRQVKFSSEGMRVYAYSGRPSTPDGINPYLTGQASWGDHTKRACIDHESCLIGSANLDERSREINSEIGVIVNHNPAFAREVEASIRKRIRDAYELTATGQYVQCQDGRERVMGPSSRDLSSIRGIRRFFQELTIGLW